MASRLLLGYAAMLLVSAVMVATSFHALRASIHDAELLRSGYTPLLVRISEALAEQNIFDAQLNHVTSARNPGDIREWIETAKHARPFTFASIRTIAEEGLRSQREPSVQATGNDVVRDVLEIERLLASEPERFAQLFQALARGDKDAAERARTDLVKRETDAAQKLRTLRTKIEEKMAQLVAEARVREASSTRLLLVLGVVTLLSGLLLTVYAQRVLAPLTRVTQRANAVAKGDLTPEPVEVRGDEIGELAATFESMVLAIKRARSELVHAERLATIGKMAAHITHEIRNPLSSIGLNLELLEEELEQSATFKTTSSLVSAIRAEVDRLGRISEQYLSVARRPSPRLESEHLEDVVQELVSFVRPEAQREGIELELRSSHDIPEVLVDESQIRQALLNLVRNSIEALPGGGHIWVSLKSDRDTAEIIVEDDGPGIPEDVRATVFDPFFTTKPRGTGLGLAITREIVEAHGGRIVCEARETGGTRMRVRLRTPSAP